MIEAIDFCEKSGVLKATYIIKMVISIIFVLVPAIIVINSMIFLTKKVISNDPISSDIIKPIITKVFIGVMIFFVPVVVKTVLSIAVGDMTSNTLENSYLSCITNATKEKIAYFENKEKAEVEEKERRKKEKTDELIRKNKEKQQQERQNNNNSNSINNANTNTNSNSVIFFVGDSRTVGMYNVIYSARMSSTVTQTKGNEFWLGAGGLGLNWFLNTAVPTIESKLASQNANVTIQLGTNDLYNNNAPSTYVNTVRNLAIKYPKSNFYIVSVNPIEDDKASSYGYTVKNYQAVNFNNKFKNAINSANRNNIKYCDTYSILAGQSGITQDGIHYTFDAYRTIYSSIKRCI